MLADGRYLLQHRDDKPDIWYPGVWGLWGGTIDDGEDAEQALRRELDEEIGWTPDTLDYFTRFDFDFSFAGYPSFPRYYYEAVYPENSLEGLVLGEGQAMQAFASEDALSLPLVPYDAFALMMHARFKSR